MTPAQAEIAGQIERAYRGYHVWTSDEWHWVRHPHPAQCTSYSIGDATVRESVSGGWPMLLASLKTLLDTGGTRPAFDAATPDRMAGSAVRE